MTEEDVKGELERLRQENERLKRERSRGISLKVSAKGAVSVYGLGRFPVTLYKSKGEALGFNLRAEPFHVPFAVPTHIDP